MAKYTANVVVLEETNLTALFYYKYLIESYNSEIKYPPVQYYDEIDKNGIETVFKEMLGVPMRDRHISCYTLDEVYADIQEVSKTVYHGFKYTRVQEDIKDEGLAKKQAQSLAKMIKNHEAPYNDIFKKYSVSIIQG